MKRKRTAAERRADRRRYYLKHKEEIRRKVAAYRVANRERMTTPRIDYVAGWRGIPGWLDPIEGACLEAAVLSTTGSIVELGTWAGRSLCCLAAARDIAKQDRPLVSFDPYPETGQAQEAGEKDMEITPAEAKAISNRVLNMFGIGNVFRFYTDAIGGAGEYRKHPHLAAFRVGLIYVDDHHSGERLLSELDAWEPLMADECEVLIHDFFHKPYGLQAAIDRFMLDHPEWVMVESMLSVARIRRRWKAVPRTLAVAKRVKEANASELTRGTLYTPRQWAVYRSISARPAGPKVSVLYNTWRLGGLDCLKVGLQRQTFPAEEYELIIIDALFDYRKEIVPRYFSDLGCRVYHGSPTHNPFPRDHGNRARNDAIRAAHGEVCVWWCDYSLADKDSLQRHYDKVACSGFRASSCGHISYGEINVEALHQDFRAALPFRTIDDYADFLEALPDTSPLWTTIFKGPPLDMARAGLIREQCGHAQPYELRGKIAVSHSHWIGRDLRREFPNGQLPLYDFYYAKNEATARALLIEINGWEESFDDGHASDDMDICRRFTLAGSILLNDKGNECIVPNPRPFFPLLRWKRTPNENRALYDTLCEINRPRAIQGLVNEIDQIPRAPMRPPSGAGSAQPAVDLGARSVSTPEAAHVP